MPISSKLAIFPLPAARTPQPFTERDVDAMFGEALYELLEMAAAEGVDLEALIRSVDRQRLTLAAKAGKVSCMAATRRPGIINNIMRTTYGISDK